MCALVDQRLHHLGMPMLRRAKERCVPVVRLDVDACAPFEQKLHQGKSAEGCGVMERRGPPFCFLLDGGALVEQLPHLSCIALFGCGTQCGRSMHPASSVCTPARPVHRVRGDKGFLLRTCPPPYHRKTRRNLFRSVFCGHRYPDITDTLLVFGDGILSFSRATTLLLAPKSVEVQINLVPGKLTA